MTSDVERLGHLKRRASKHFADRAGPGAVFEKVLELPLALGPHRWPVRRGLTFFSELSLWLLFALIAQQEC